RSSIWLHTWSHGLTFLLLASVIVQRRILTVLLFVIWWLHRPARRLHTGCHGLRTLLLIIVRRQILIYLRVTLLGSDRPLNSLHRGSRIRLRRSARIGWRIRPV